MTSKNLRQIHNGLQPWEPNRGCSCNPKWLQKGRLQVFLSLELEIPRIVLHGESNLDLRNPGLVDQR